MPTGIIVHRATRLPLRGPGILGGVTTAPARAQNRRVLSPLVPWRSHSAPGACRRVDRACRRSSSGRRPWQWRTHTLVGKLGRRLKPATTVFCVTQSAERFTAVGAASVPARPTLAQPIGAFVPPRAEHEGFAFFPDRTGKKKLDVE